jgi:hypothetical protein
MALLRQGAAIRQKEIQIHVQYPLHAFSLPVSTVYHYLFSFQHGILKKTEGDLRADWAKAIHPP